MGDRPHAPGTNPLAWLIETACLGIPVMVPAQFGSDPLLFAGYWGWNDETAHAHATSPNDQVRAMAALAACTELRRRARRAGATVTTR